MSEREREPSGLWAILVVVSGISKWYMQMKKHEFHRVFSFLLIFSLAPQEELRVGRQATWKMSVGFHAEADVLVLPLPCDVER